MKRLTRIRQGLFSAFAAGVFIAGDWWRRSIADLQTPQRYGNGLVVVLPGIQGRSNMEYCTARGLVDAGEEGGGDFAVEIFDWTTSLWPLCIYHLWKIRSNRIQARKLAERLCRYQDEHPGKPVHLVGHSGGAAMCLLTLAALPPSRQITSVTLLAAACSPRIPLEPLLAKTTAGIHNFYSPLDLLFLGFFCSTLGTLDRKWTVAAGCCGFKGNAHPQLQQIGFSPRMMLSFNMGGHLGCLNRVFVANYVAPALYKTDK